MMLNGPEILRGARTIAQKSASKQRMEVITRGARPYWRPDEKQEIVPASLAHGAMTSAIFRELGTGSGQLNIC